MSETWGADLGIVGLGVMGRNLLWNFAEHGCRVAGFDTQESKVRETEAPNPANVAAESTREAFFSRLSSPRHLLLLVPAGRPVDEAIRSLLPWLRPGDLVIDGGNSHFRDTARREKELAEEGIAFFGMGISGGEEGARTGPSLMPGGDPEAFQRVRPWLEAVAAKVHGEPCLAHLGAGPAGHYVKMVHNAIEYGLMQLIAESFDLLQRGLGLSASTIGSLFSEWNQGELESFLMATSAKVLGADDRLAKGKLIEKVSDVARQKGTGKWATEEGRELHVPIPTLDVAVTMRDLSAQKELRRRLEDPAPRGAAGIPVREIREALWAASLLTYAQGLALMREASKAYAFGTDLQSVARVWRGGCIIRSRLLDPIAEAYRKQPSLEHLLEEAELTQALKVRRPALAALVSEAVRLRLPVAAHASALFYLDALQGGRLPLSLVQAQRDCFGAHGYERIDREGTFHTDWDSQ